jgi:hypothetical protein
VGSPSPLRLPAPPRSRRLRSPSRAAFRRPPRRCRSPAVPAGSTALPRRSR